MRRLVTLILTLVLALLTIGLPADSLPVRAQGQEDCGVVDAIAYPVDNTAFLPQNDDFGLYRAGYNGRHAGVDMAFGRYGDPVRASARGRVTFSDPEGWDVAKGVVIIEHQFPDGRTYFSLYGHMEPINGYTFPKVGQCIKLGEIVGAVGNPKNAAPHLHYEIRQMRASTGGPGYWNVDPLLGGWYHPIEFTERWQLRFTKAFRTMWSANVTPIGPSISDGAGGMIFATESGVEWHSATDEVLYKLDVRGLTGMVRLPDGRILVRTTQNQIFLVENGRFVASWQPDRPLASPPMLLGNALVFLTPDNRVVSYSIDGKLAWATDPFTYRIEQIVQSGGLLALASGDQDNSYLLWIINSAGQVAYKAAAPAPIVPVALPGGGFLVLVASQVNIIGADMSLRALFDANHRLLRGSSAAMDSTGNVYVYPGQGKTVYAFGPDGALRWQADLPKQPQQQPLLAVGKGCLVYSLLSDGTLSAFAAADGQLRGTAELYYGGVHTHLDARFLRVLDNEQVEFSAGYLSTVVLDGLTLGNLQNCG